MAEALTVPTQPILLPPTSLLRRTVWGHVVWNMVGSGHGGQPYKQPLPPHMGEGVTR